MQSNPCRQGLHVAIIMDGSGRWATSRGLPRSAGHRAGVDAVRSAARTATRLGIERLTLFAFSGENWTRETAEIDGLMSIFRQFLRDELGWFLESGTRVAIIGRRDRLPEALIQEVRRTEAATEAGRRLELVLAIDYSSRDAIANAASSWLQEFPFSRDIVGRDFMFRELMGRRLAQSDARSADVDLLLRTGGQKRLSDFLLWECAFAELCFLDKMWPDFGADDLSAAVDDFRRRERSSALTLPAEAPIAS